MNLKEKIHNVEKTREQNGSLDTLQLLMEELLGTQITSGTTIKRSFFDENHKNRGYRKFLNVFLKDDDSGKMIS